MVEKMIRNTYIEIFLIVIFIILSIPLWHILSTRWHLSLAETIKYETKLELIRNDIDGYDNIIVNNSSEITKKYQLLLVLDEICNNDYIIINSQKYQLKDLQSKKQNDKYIYVLATGTVKQSRNGYKVVNNFPKYYYILEEITYF